MISKKDPTKYRKVFEFPIKGMKFDHHRTGRKYRYHWSNPGGHKPYAVEYWPSFDLGDDHKAFYAHACAEPYPCGSFFIRWRDNVGDFVTQEFLLYVHYRKPPSHVTKAPEMARGAHWSVACTGVRDMSTGQLCGCRGTKLVMPYHKIAWGCVECLKKQDVIYEYPLSEVEPDNEWWYDKILGIEDGRNLPPRDIGYIDVNVDGGWFD